MKRLDSLEASYRCCWWGFWLFIILLAVGWLTSCTTSKVVTVEKVKTDTTYITKHHRDSVWLHDSINVSEKGDTIRIERWRTKYVEREVHDTLYRAKHDSVPVPYPVEKIVPAELSWWQQARIHLANILLFGLVIVGIIMLGKWHLKKLKP